MKKKENYIKYFADNVDEIELLAYICQSMFNLMKLFNMNEEKIYKKYEYTNNCDNLKTDKKTLHNPIVYKNLINLVIIIDSEFLIF